MQNNFLKYFVFFFRRIKILVIYVQHENNMNTPLQHWENTPRAFFWRSLPSFFCGVDTNIDYRLLLQT